MNWQPIDTAPKDGTNILAVVEERDLWRGGGWHEPSVCFTRWEAKPEVCGDNPFWLDMSGPCSTYECFRPYTPEDIHITHWMPLPALPPLADMEN